MLGLSRGGAWLTVVVALVGCAGGALQAADAVVHKTADDFEATSWAVNPDSMAKGQVRLVGQVAPEAAAKSKQAMEATAQFSGGGNFEFFAVIPPTPLTIPGQTKRLSAWVKADGGGLVWVLNLKDGWGRNEVAGKRLDWVLTDGSNSQWRKITFDVPADWMQPITLGGVTTHNFGVQGKKFSSTICLDQIEVETNLADVDTTTGRPASWKANPAAAAGDANSTPTAPLLSAGISSAAIHNVFVAPNPPLFSLQARSWQSKAATGKLAWKLLDNGGAVVKTGEQTLRVDDILNLSLPLDIKKYGLYSLETDLSWEGGTATHAAQALAFLPAPRELSAADKDQSPYGLNVNGGRGSMVETFRNAGIIWYREYAFDYDWMGRAKGADKSYGGWPWYPKIVNTYESNDVRLLACFMGSIRRNRPNSEVVPEHKAPDTKWKREMVFMMTAFPFIRTYELDNEYDLPFRSGENAEVTSHWLKYRNYHKAFGQMVEFLGGGEWLAVENGAAGIYPERIRLCVASGDFDRINVVNSHHYTGTEPPEINIANFNTGFDGSEATLTFFDQLRAAKAAGCSDGKQRQHWLTEFGWDTASGPAVSPFQQAAYLPRAFMMLLASGSEKGFWFFDLDAPKPVQIFDSSGLVTDKQLPKLSLCSFAGLTQMLPRPKFVGLINAGDDTWGCLFRNDGQLVASLWTIQKPTGPTVRFDSGKLYDYLGNPIAGPEVTLTEAPVYAVGVAESSRWFAQSAYMLQTPFLVTAASGDTLASDVQIKNDRKTAIHGTATVEVPAGWTAGAKQSFTVDPGQTKLVPVTYRIAADEPLGEKSVRIQIAEDQPLLTIPVRVRSEVPVLMSVRGIKGEPGDAAFSVRLTNRSAQPMEGTLSLRLPASWSTTTPQVKVTPMKSMESREIPCRVTGSAQWKEGESAMAEFVTADGRSAKQPLIPTRLTLRRADKLVMDGDLKDWPASAKLPAWVLGCTTGQADADLYAAWAPEGLYIAVAAKNSKLNVAEPQSFWAEDCLELFIDTRDQKTPRKYQPTDHQFWAIPLVDQKRVYVGRWKRDEEIPANKLDIPGIKSASKRTADGYVMEFLLPADQIQQYNPTKGSRIGLNLNLSILHPTLTREVYWPQPKAWSAPTQPENWGSVELGD